MKVIVDLYSEQIIKMFWLTVMSVKVKYFCNHEGHQSFYYVYFVWLLFLNTKNMN